jgi:peptide/nickel transport system permease protein
MLILLFAVRLGWLPASGYVPPWEDLGRNLTTMLMPSIVLGTGCGRRDDAPHAAAPCCRR